MTSKWEMYRTKRYAIPDGTPSDRSDRRTVRTLASVISRDAIDGVEYIHNYIERPCLNGCVANNDYLLDCETCKTLHLYQIYSNQRQCE